MKSIRKAVIPAAGLVRDSYQHESTTKGNVAYR